MYTLSWWHMFYYCVRVWTSQTLTNYYAKHRRSGATWGTWNLKMLTSYTISVKIPWHFHPRFRCSQHNAEKLGNCKKKIVHASCGAPKYSHYCQAKLAVMPPLENFLRAPMARITVHHQSLNQISSSSGSLRQETPCPCATYVLRDNMRCEMRRSCANQSIEFQTS